MFLLATAAFAAPTVLSPVDGIMIAEHDVTLYVEDDGLPVTFEADTPDGSTYEGIDIAGDGVRVAWAIPVTLPEDTTTCWRAWTDPGDVVESCFLVNSTNDAPTAPGLVLDGSQVVVSPGVDPELRDVWTTVRLDGADTEHAGPDDIRVDVDEYFVLMARTSDGARVSDWVELRVEPEVEEPIEDTGPVIEDTGPDEPAVVPDPIDEDAEGYSGGGGLRGCSVAPLAAAPWLVGLVLVARRRREA